MNKTLLWMGGLAAGGVALIAGMSWAFAAGEKKESAKLTQLPLKPGNMTATIPKGGTIDLIVPAGSTPLGAEASPTVFSPEPSPAPLTFRFSAFTSGPGAINVMWQDASGARQDTFVAVTVT